MPRQRLTPERVIDLAAEVADVEGLDAVSLKAVAARARVRPPSLYKHVDGLDGIREGLAVRGLSLLAREVEQAAVGRAREDAVWAVAHRYRAFAREHPGLYAAIQPSHLVGSDAVRETGERAMRVILAVFRGYDLDGDALIHAARAFRAAVHGFADLERRGGFGVDVDVDESFAFLVEALVARLHMP